MQICSGLLSTLSWLSQHCFQALWRLALLFVAYACVSVSHTVDPVLRGQLGGPSVCTPSCPLRKTSMTLQPNPSLLCWRCLQWEWPHALLEERERFIKDWRDRALSVFYWRLPAFLWACLLQQHWYVRLEMWGPLSCPHFVDNHRAPALFKSLMPQ